MRDIATRQQGAFKRVFSEHGITPDIRIGFRGFPGPRFISWRVGLRDSSQLKKALSLSEELALVAGVENVIATRQRGIIRYDFTLPQSYWQSYTRKQLKDSRSIGIVDRNQEMTFGWHGHKIFAGSTGSGKSVAIQSAIHALVDSFSPETLDLLIASPHAGADFLSDSDGVDFSRLPHLADDIAHKKNDIEALIMKAWAVYKHREENNETEQNGRAKKLVLVLDEVQHDSILGPEPKPNKVSNLEKLQHLASESRKFNIRLVIGTQKPSQKALPRVFDNLEDRYIGRVTDATISSNLTGLAGAEAHKLTGKGDFYHVENGSVVRFQVAQPTRGQSLPSGPMNPFPAMLKMAANEPAQYESMATAGRPADPLDYRVLGRILAFGMKHKRNPGSGIARRWGMHPRKLQRHIEAFRTAPMRAFLAGFMEEMAAGQH